MIVGTFFCLVRGIAYSDRQVFSVLRLIPKMFETTLTLENMKESLQFWIYQGKSVRE